MRPWTCRFFLFFLCHDYLPDPDIREDLLTGLRPLAINLLCANDGFAVTPRRFADFRKLPLKVLSTFAVSLGVNANLPKAPGFPILGCASAVPRSIAMAALTVPPVSANTFRRSDGMGYLPDPDIREALLTGFRVGFRTAAKSAPLGGYPIPPPGRLAFRLRSDDLCRLSENVFPTSRASFTGISISPINPFCVTLGCASALPALMAAVASRTC